MDSAIPILFHCRRCDWVLGRIVGVELHIHADVNFVRAVLPRKATVRCPHCRTDTLWGPRPQTTAEQEARFSH